MWSNLTWYFWTEVIPLDIACRFRDLLKTHPNSLRWFRKIILGDRFCPYYDLFNFYMTDEMAEWIRTKRNCSQRWLVKEFMIKYPGTNVDGTQYDGRELFRYAQAYLQDESIDNIS